MEVHLTHKNTFTTRAGVSRQTTVPASSGGAMPTPTLAAALQPGTACKQAAAWCHIRTHSCWCLPHHVGLPITHPPCSIHASSQRPCMLWHSRMPSWGSMTLHPGLLWAAQAELAALGHQRLRRLSCSNCYRWEQCDADSLCSAPANSRLWPLITAGNPLKCHWPSWLT